MPASRKFLVVDDNADSRFLLVKTLLRKFPQAAVHEMADAQKAVAMAETIKFTALVIHRAVEVDGITLVQMLREVAPTVPIVMVSGFDRSREAVAAGANTFLSYEAWLRIGTVVAELIEPAHQKTPNGETETSGQTALR